LTLAFERDYHATCRDPADRRGTCLDRSSAWELAVDANLPVESVAIGNAPIDNPPPTPPTPVAPSPAPSGLGIGRTLYFCLVFYLNFIAVCLVGTTLAAIFGLAEDPQLTQLLVLLIPQTFAWLVTIRLAQRRFNRPLAELALLAPFPLRIVPALVVASFGAQILLSELITRLLPMPEWLKAYAAEQWETGLVLVPLLAVAVVAPLAEEIFFRGLVLRGFIARYSVTKAVVASSLLFSLFHLNPWQMIPALPLGLWYAWMVLRTGSVLPGMLSHAVVNFSGLFLVIPLMQLLGYPDDLWKEIDHHPPLILAIGAVSAITGGTLLWWQLKDRSSSSPPSPSPPSTSAPI
jgi:membrane protease YdiL (CAAX protease family)